MHQGPVQSQFLFAIALDVVAELAREDMSSELLYADNLFLMSETIERFRNKQKK